MKAVERTREQFIKVEETPLWRCEWRDVVFLHFEVDENLLKAELLHTSNFTDNLYSLEKYDGKAIVSFVAFTLRNFTLFKFHNFFKLFFKPVREQKYFNVRTYIKTKHESGIFFLKEWISNKLAHFFGKYLYALPLLLGELDYNNQVKNEKLKGKLYAKDSQSIFDYSAFVNKRWRQDIQYNKKIRYFLTEKYYAICADKRNLNYFRIWHTPWDLYNLELKFIENNFFANLGNWANEMKFLGADYSPGFEEVLLGSPHNLLKLNKIQK